MIETQSINKELVIKNSFKFVLKNEFAHNSLKS